MNVLETDRLVLRQLSLDDAEFILELLNEPSFLQFIGDKGVRTLADAREYIRQGPVQSYERHGFGLYLSVLKEGAVSIGICGLLKRESLADVDIGFAFLPRFWSKGYALEAALAVKAFGLNSLGLNRIVAITNPDNEASIKLLEKLGLTFERMIRLSEDSAAIKLYASGARASLPAGAGDMMGILRLYELRSEEKMRQARDWFATGFYPESAQEILRVLIGEHSADFRMVASYWDMAAAFVIFGAINGEMFNAINTEHVAVYAKLQPFLAELRAVPGVPPFIVLKHLEPVVLLMPDAEERVAAMQRYMKSRRPAPAETTSDVKPAD